MLNVIMMVGASVFLLSIAGGAVMLVRLSSDLRSPIGFEGAYLHLISFITLFVSLFSLLSLTEPLLGLALGGKTLAAMDRWMREDLINRVALLLVAFPAWVLSWRRVRRLVLQKDDLLHRFYLYGVATIAFTSAVVVVASLLSGLFRSLLGVIGWPVLLQKREVVKDLISGVINSLVASGVWLYHWRLAQRLPGGERAKPEAG
ncbi:MAG: DUF5671 domain-containing protein [Anaerolineae bacterium]